ncbi:hypothetical protein [Reyranella sp. CPCC 100927]|uniref:hypothetical protein n=1 Tax=Reyranella sp. CPCC 100927 TaxID=2599616 RepID=UPI0011B76213|nr:hypothetical protein [Reyranella sp. CPCC 100927]TWT11705.1 hypothetical protein FQU96_14620 [Reyranella sp. CPCC 100927]
MGDPSWRDLRDPFDTLFRMLPSETQASLRPWGGLMNPLEWTPGAGIRDAVDASADTARAVRSLDPWGTLAGVGYMGLGLLSAMVPPLRQVAPARLPMQNASKSARIFNPPTKPPRAFEADYRKEPPADATGQLTHDIEGRELTAPLVVGRRMVGMDDVALPPAQLDTLGTSLTGRSPESLPPSKMGGNAGLYREWFDPVTGHRERAIALDKTLPAVQVPRVVGHETGHGIYARIPFGIPTEGVEHGYSGLRRVYNDLNTDPSDWRMLKSAKTGEPVPPRYWTSPESRGYRAGEVVDELWAEAFRAYMANPNYLKATAPKVAARIRAYANPNPATNRYIQFNSLAAPALAFGMLLPAVLDEERQP